MHDWRHKLDPVLKEYLEHLVHESSSERKAYAHSKKPGEAQLWVALAMLARENAQLKQENKSFKELALTLNQKYKFLEKVMREINPKKVPKDNEDPAKALKDVLRKL